MQIASIKTSILISALAMGAQIAQAQFNDSTHHLVTANINGTFNRTNDGLTYLLNNNLKYATRYKNFVMNANTGWIYGKTPLKLSNNDWNAALDFNWYKSLPHFYYWGLLNFTSSYSLKIDNQSQMGLGAAYRIIDRSPNIMLSLSSGFLYEYSNIIPQDGIPLSYSTIRNSTRLQFNYKLANELIEFKNVLFYQPSIIHGGDFIFNTNANLSLNILKWIKLTTSFTYNHISRTQRENVIFAYGIELKHYF
jgi:hypothetical protein